MAHTRGGLSSDNNFSSSYRDLSFSVYVLMYSIQRTMYVLLRILDSLSDTTDELSGKWKMNDELIGSSNLYPKLRLCLSPSTRIK